MEWMILPLKRYADFSGRSRRKEYWMFTLGIFLTFALAAFLLVFTFDVTHAEGSGGTTVGLITVLGLVYLAILIPAIAVQVRRFHDQDKSGWFVLMNFIPYVGGIIVLVFMCLEGTRGANRFGPDPKNSEGDLQNVFS